MRLARMVFPSIYNVSFGRRSRSRTGMFPSADSYAAELVRGGVL